MNKYEPIGKSISRLLVERIWNIIGDNGRQIDYKTKNIVWIGGGMEVMRDVGDEICLPIRGEILTILKKKYE